MRLFRVDSDKKFIEYQIQEFKEENREEDLELLLEINPSSILNEDILVIGRQVTTNLNTFMDLLALDYRGNCVIIELKRDRTPRDTIAQALEYASFIEPLDYAQLEQIYQEYTGNENESLSDYHRAFFQLNETDVVDFNKEQIIVIVGSQISREIRQQTIFLNRKGIRTLCVEFNYFQTISSETLLSTDIVIGDEQLKPKTISTEKRPIINQTKFLERTDKYGEPFFKDLFSLAEENGYPIHWGSVGFSLNVDINGKHISICEGYPPRINRNQILYVGFRKLLRQFDDISDFVEKFKHKLLETGYFEHSGENLKWLMISSVQPQDSQEIINILNDMAIKVKSFSLA